MNAVILGAGRRGLRLAHRLIQENKSVTIVDSSKEKCTQTVAKLDCMAVCGSATDLSVLKEAGCEEADFIVAVTDSDEVNLVACGIAASNFRKAKTVSAIRGVSYVGSDNEQTKILGIDHVVNPDLEAASRISGILQSGLFSDVITFDDADFILFSSNVSSGQAEFEGKTLIEVKKALPGNYVIIGIKRGSKVFTPSGNTVLQKGDELAIMAVDDDSESIYKAFRGTMVNTRLRRIIIVGGTRITKFLLQELPTKTLRRITLIERDAEVCREFSDDFPQILVLNESITDENLWEDERLSAADLIISVTENDELNIITASYAKRIGTKRSIALLKTNPNYVQFAQNMDIDVAISTTEATVDTIMKHVRGDAIKTLHSTFNGDLEVYEYVLTDSFSKLGKQLMEVDLRGKCIIAGIKRSKIESFVPNGTYQFTAGDTVLVACAHENYDFVTGFFK
ncbi:MAG: Trk system potassium transporter TrkA [Spirochaetales bacterium]|nr:Trk system potassium transporter TrkA [Candidatus Physcosoma equi]